MNESQFNALPLAQRKAIQQQLKDQGFYAGGIDGQFGAGTATAFKLREEAEARTAQQEREGRIAETQAEAEAEKSKAEADRIRAESEAERQRLEQRRQYNEDANSPEGAITSMAAGAPAFVTGYVTGRGMGGGINKLADMSQESRNRVLQGAAQDRLEGRTTREGARAGTERSGAMPTRNPLLRTTARMAPHLLTGATMAGKGGLMLADEGGESFYADQVNRAAGLGMIGAGSGIAERGIAYATNPGVSPDARSIAIMESNQIRRTPPGSAAQTQTNRLLQDQDTPPAAQQPAPRAAPAPGSKAALQQQARDLNVPGRSQMNKAQLAEAVAEKLRTEGGKRTTSKRAKASPKAGALGPLTAAAFAYGMTPDEAQASTGQDAQPTPQEHAYSGSPEDDFAYGQGTTSGGVNEEALTNAGIVGGLSYGMNRLIPRGAMPIVGGAMGPVAAMTGPDFTPETEKFAANAAVRDMPWVRHVLPGRQEAYDMAQVPERNPARVYGNAYQPPGGQPDDFDTEIAELQRLLSEMEGGGQQPMPQPQFSVPQPSAGPQNRLLAVR